MYPNEKNPTHYIILFLYYIMLDADGFELNTSDFKDICATIWTNPEFEHAQFWVLELNRKINRSHLELI